MMVMNRSGGADLIKKTVMKIKYGLGTIAPPQIAVGGIALQAVGPLGQPRLPGGINHGHHGAQTVKGQART